MSCLVYLLTYIIYCYVVYLKDNIYLNQIMKISQKEIIEVIKKVTKKKIDINSSSKNISDWDSLAQLNILTVLDNKLKGKIFTIKQMATADSVKKIILLLKKNNFLSKD